MSTFLVTVFLAIAGIITYLAQKKDDEDFAEYREQKRKDELTELVVKSEDREDLTEYNEDDFWALIERIDKRSQGNQHNSLGVLKDLLFQFSPQKLIQLDNLIVGLYKRHLTFEVTGATWIIFKQKEIILSLLLMNLMMLKGRVFFKNACLNTELLIGKSFQGIEARLFNNVIEEVYFQKTNSFIPSHPDELNILEPKGDPWTLNEVPRRFSNLWKEFA